MINKQIISNYIGQFQGLTLSKGHKILVDGDIKDVSFIQSNVVSANVLDYQTTLIYNEDLNKIFPECSCRGNGTCDHVAALSLYLHRNYNEIKSSKKVPIFKFDSADCDEWRTLTKKDEDDWNTVLNEVMSKRLNSLYTFDTAVLNEDNQFDVNLVNTFGNNGLAMKFAVKENELQAICTCDEKTLKFCSHQNTAFHTLLDIGVFRNWLQGKETYSTQVDQFAEKLLIDKSYFKEHFDLRIEYGENIKSIPKNGHFYQDINKHIEQQLSIPSLEEEKELIASEKDIQKYGQGILWVDSEKVNFTIIQGKLNKDRNTMINSFELVAFPNLLNEEINDLVTRLRKISLKYSPDYHQANIKILEVLQNNYLLLNENHNFHFDDYERDILKADGTLEDYEYIKISKKSLTPFRFAEETCVYSIFLSVEQNFLIARMQMKIGDNIIKPPHGYSHTALYTLIDHRAYLHEKPLSSSHDKLVLLLENLYIPLDKSQQVLKDLKALEDYYFVHWEEVDESHFIELENGQRELYIEEHGELITMEPVLKYGDFAFNLINPTYDNEDNKIVQYNKRELEEYREVLNNLHPKFDVEKTPYSVFTMSYQDIVKGMWFLNFFEQCKINNIDVYGEDNLSKLKFNHSIPSITTHISSKQNWFDVDVNIQFGDYPVSMREWVDAIKNKSRYVKLKDGSLGVLPETWFNKLRDIYEMSEQVKGELHVNQYKFNEIEEVFDEEEIEGSDLYEKLKAKRDRLLTFETDKKYDLPASLNAELRPYQLVGYQWLRFLDEYGMGGILADEMGLGKTLQMIALLASFKERGIERASLIVVPRSLLFNWMEELKKFCPSIKAWVHHGSQRRVDEEAFMKYDVIITTYDTVVQDAKKLHSIEFHYIILDESQAIKNPSTKRFRTVTQLNATNRLAMTGTPIENNTFDLYAQFSFVNPGIFGSATHFKNNYSRPIDVLEDARVSEKLQRIISPYILRRTKKQVAEDLPPKTESIIYCELAPTQREMYESMKNKIRNDIAATLNDDSKKNKASFLAVEGLLRLRQICNSPYLVDQTLPESKRESSKLNILINILSHDLGDSSALVFSQFTSLLALIREKLDANGIKYAYLDGSTKDRKAAVDYFQNNDDIQIFLISLKAGNTGLNLTKAEYVYIVDPWWNPAVEAQAIDRTHRIGQDKHIIAYRMICVDTIEEKILNLQKRKKKLASDLIHSEEELYKAMNKNELLELFDL